MGTHAFILVKKDYKTPGICFYQHYDGYDISSTVAGALAVARADDRLGDFGYLNRIIFSQMLLTERDPLNALEETVGYGIFLEEWFDRSCPHRVEIDLERQAVSTNGGAWIPIDKFIEYEQAD